MLHAPEAVVVDRQDNLYISDTMNHRVRTIGTTAFTKKPVSMKYRGLFALHNRKEDALNYLGDAGKWTLDEALAWWQKTQNDYTRANVSERTGGVLPQGPDDTGGPLQSPPETAF